MPRNPIFTLVNHINLRQKRNAEIGKRIKDLKKALTSGQAKLEVEWQALYETFMNKNKSGHIQILLNDDSKVADYFEVVFHKDKGFERSYRNFIPSTLVNLFIENGLNDEACQAFLAYFGEDNLNEFKLVCFEMRYWTETFPISLKYYGVAYEKHVKFFQKQEDGTWLDIGPK